MKEKNSANNQQHTYWQESSYVFSNFEACMEEFLESWKQRMYDAGYLKFTTARRIDCINAVNTMLYPILAHAEKTKEQYAPCFESLRCNHDNWAEPLLEFGLSHLQRGITSAMFLGCFKTFILAICDAISLLPSLNPAISTYQVLVAEKILRLYADAFEVIFVDACERLPLQKHNEEREEVIRLLTYEKCRFENIFNTTSDGVLVMDSSCKVSTANHSLRLYVGENIEGKYIWEVLGLEGESAEEFFRFYPVGQTIEIKPFKEGLTFRLSMISLGSISLASATEYLVLLTNITPHVLQREMLEAAIDKYNEDLQSKSKQVNEMNITLHNVLTTFSSEQERKTDELSEQVRAFLQPAIHQLAKEPSLSVREHMVNHLWEQVNRLLDGTPLESAKLYTDKKFRHLTLTELRICSLIKQGSSTKEIATALKISPETVQTHRKNIRKKLGVSGHKTQLALHLLEFEAQDTQE